MVRVLSGIAAALLANSVAYAQYNDYNAKTYDRRFGKRSNAAPVMDGQNFPDPAIIRMSDGWHAFATNTKIDGARVHVPMANSPDFKRWTYRLGVDAMPKLASWIDKESPRVWAPDVVRLDDGTFVMYYTAGLAKETRLHCVSYATSKRVDGPYVDNLDDPWICPTAIGGAIDPAGYMDSDGTRWVVYKVDGNAIGHGGACNNMVPPMVSTPIMLQRVSARDGHTKIGAAIRLITNGPADGPVVEAPAIAKLGGNNCFNTEKYDVSYAIATNLEGPYTKYGPLFVTGNHGMHAPGGLDIAIDGDHAIWHAYVKNQTGLHDCIAKHHKHGRAHRADDCSRNAKGGRAAFTALLSLNGNVVTAKAIS
ncbi:hypothetical protein LTR53_009597 [Teratosphaeriaceae sp. CCFEE 6253]|nr:hypothetical protein LTR53_009597 [Teratosphaeriaceae sp. CCFEE 6253]